MNVIDLAKSVSDFAIVGEGNVSVRKDNNLLIKASGTELNTLTCEDLVECDLQGNALEGQSKKPSMEVSFHAWILENFKEINCVCHTHPVNTNKILCSESCHSFADERLFPDQVVRNGRKSCLVPYATPGRKLRDEIKKQIKYFIDDEGFFPKLILLENHGIITAAPSVKDCLYSTLMCEKSAKIFIGAKLLGGINFLTEEQIAEIDNDPSEKYRRSLI
tara:strand:- start:2625 stop:3281 length:657 start_codon:yes stop_codon:yes gene_type:complete